MSTLSAIYTEFFFAKLVNLTKNKPKGGAFLSTLYTAIMQSDY